MKKLNILLYASMFSILLSSCEKNIDIKLDESASRIVIEGIITDQEKPLSVKISKSGSYFNTSEYPKLSGASVVITDSQGNTFTLNEKSKGIYETDENIKGMPGTTYSLTVNAEGNTYRSATTMPSPVLIDSISFEKTVFMGSDSQYVVKCYFMDPSVDDNNYRFNFYNNNKLVSNHLMNDKYTNGNSTTSTFFGEDIEKNDSIYLELNCVDKEVYQYFYTLQQIADGQGNTGAPENPKSNISNGALGYFGAFTHSSKHIVIE